MDIIERLQKLVGVYIGDADIDDELLDAKSEIERLREALQQIKSYRYSNYENAIQNFNDLQNIARAALKEGK